MVISVVIVAAMILVVVAAMILVVVDGEWDSDLMKQLEEPSPIEQ